MLLLGEHHNLKVGHKQFALADSLIAEVLVSAFSLSTAGADRLSSFTSVGQWNLFIKKYTKLAGLDPLWTSHSPRAGWAVEQRMQGVAFAEIRELGRWRSDGALRTYLDVANSHYMQLNLQHVAATAEWLEADFCARFPCW